MWFDCLSDIDIHVKKNRKPPLGLTPKWLHDEMRFKEVCDAIRRAWDANYAIPIEWVEEYNELVVVCKQAERRDA